MFHIILNFLFFNEIYTYITFQFHTLHNREKENYIKDISENIIYTYLKIGFPPQKIGALIFPNESFLKIEGNKCEIQSNFILEKSNTYESQEYSKQYKTNITLSYLIKDKFEFIFNETNDIESIGQIDYIYSPNNNSKINNHLYPCISIGFSPIKYDFYEPTENIIFQLRKLKAIKKYCYFIIYDNYENDNGKIILGEYPDIYEPNKYKKYQLKSLYSLKANNEYNWELEFNSIHFDFNSHKIFDDNLESIIDFSSGLIFSPEEFFNGIYSHYFKDKINKGSCQISEYKSNLDDFKYIICNSINEVESFPAIYFKQSFLMYTFVLNKNDLFKKIADDKYLFLICFNKKFKNKWKLGKPFLKKYLFFFNYDDKFLGFYNPDLNEEGILIDKTQNNKIVENKDNNGKNIIIIFIIVFSCFTFLVFFIISKKYYIRRKNKKNIIKNNERPFIRELTNTEGDEEKY